MSGSSLSDFQIELARLFFSLPDSAGFLLAGGGALIVQGIVPRPTEDLDFFTSIHLGSVEAASKALVTAVTDRGWTAELLRAGEEFRRWKITGPEVVLVDLAVDSPAVAMPQLTIAGPALAPDELAVRKLLALFGRAEPRDFIDVYVLHQIYDRDETLARATDADPGFDPGVFARALRTHARLDDIDFPNVGVDIAVVRAYFDSWADEIDPI